MPRSYVIPKRVFPDEGVALWQLLGTSLIGTRMLIPSPIETTAGRRRFRAITNIRS